jgi:signal transduction histidine kinase
VPEIHELIHSHLFEQAPIMIALLDPDLKVVASNDRFRKVVGDCSGKRCFEAFRNRDEVCEGCLALKTFEDGQVRIHDEILSLPSGGTGHYVTRLAPLTSEDNGHPPYVIWMASDVNEASSLLHENEILFEGVPCYVCVLDRDLKIIRANRRMRNTFGRHRRKYCYEVYKEREAPCDDCPALRAFEDGKEHTGHHIGTTADGDEAHYIVTAAPLTWEGGTEGGRVTHVIEISTDITQVHRLEKEKLDAERLAAVGQTVAGLAHGIKNILMGIEGGVYVMESGLRKEQPVKIERGFRMLSRNVDKISGLVRNLLSFSRGTVPKVVSTNPNAIAREVYELYHDKASQLGVQLLSNLSPGIPLAPLDPEGIHTCLANLVSNAIDACQASEQEGCRVILSSSEENGVIRFQVEDDGCGMDYEVKKKIFTTFFTTKGGGGTGLGLLMTRKIVQEHGGRIEVESEPGEGTTFSVLLPRNRLPKLDEVKH